MCVLLALQRMGEEHLMLQSQRVKVEQPTDIKFRHILKGSSTTKSFTTIAERQSSLYKLNFCVEKVLVLGLRDNFTEMVQFIYFWNFSIFDFIRSGHVINAENQTFLFDNNKPFDTVNWDILSYCL